MNGPRTSTRRTQTAQPVDPFADDDFFDDDDDDDDPPRRQVVRSTCTHQRSSFLDRMVGAHNVSTMRPPIPAATYLAWLVVLVVGSAVVAAVGTVLIVVAGLGGVAFLGIRNYIQLSRR